MQDPMSLFSVKTALQGNKNLFQQFIQLTHMAFILKDITHRTSHSTQGKEASHLLSSQFERTIAQCVIKCQELEFEGTDEAESQVTWSIVPFVII